MARKADRRIVFAEIVFVIATLVSLVLAAFLMSSQEAATGSAVKDSGGANVEIPSSDLVQCCSVSVDGHESACYALEGNDCSYCYAAC